MNDGYDVELLLREWNQQRKAYSGFLNNVTDFFGNDNGKLIDVKGRFVVHSIKSRLKDTAKIAGKINRKHRPENPITIENLFTRITDFSGARILHLRLSDCGVIHAAIEDHVKDKHWCFAEPPKAYTWDPEYKSYFEGLGLKTEVKDSSYTSVHYVVKPNAESFVTCEIQVRSLLEEVWGEIDRDLNYLRDQDSSFKEQLKVLAKLIGAGTKLVESIYGSAN